MPKCPVCKTEYEVGSHLCPNCRFSDLQRTFISVDEAEYWTKTTVRDYRIKWMASLKCFTFDRTYTELIKYTGMDSHVSVPYGVQVVRDAFSENDYVQTVELPETVIHIGENAFKLCKKLIEVKLPNGVKKIGTLAFGYCDKLKITIPASVTEIAEQAFPQVQTIYVESSNPVFKMESGLLIDAKQGILLAAAFPSPLMDVVVPNYVRRIGCMAFMIARNIPNTITLPTGLQSLGSSSNVNSAHKPITIPNTVTKIEDGALAAICKDIDLEDGNPYYIKRNNTIIEKETRKLISVCNKNCESVRISPAVRSIAAWAFDTCQNLTDIKLHGHIEEIGYCAFHACSKLEHIVIPRGIKQIGYAVFYSCHSLKGVYCENGRKPHGWHLGWLEKCNAKVYWENEWKFVPQPIVKK